MPISEGILSFIVPKFWHDAFRRMIQFIDGQVRFVGLASMVVGGGGVRWRELA